MFNLINYFLLSVFESNDLTLLISVSMLMNLRFTEDFKKFKLEFKLTLQNQNSFMILILIFK